jgi:hypothetical protein
VAGNIETTMAVAIYFDMACRITTGARDFESMRTESLSVREPWFDELEHAACFDGAALAGELDRLKTRAAVSMQILCGPVLGRLADAAGGLAFRPARSEVGKPEARVYQEFGYCGSIPAAHAVSRLASWFETRLRDVLVLMQSPPIPMDFTINDIVCQQYLPGDRGISPHRDHVSYTGLIILVLLSGRGRYFVCKDRRGGHCREIPSAPGWAILMPGPGYAGRGDRPFHMVGDITSLRYSVGLRHDKRKPPAS